MQEDWRVDKGRNSWKSLVLFKKVPRFSEKGPKGDEILDKHVHSEGVVLNQQGNICWRYDGYVRAKMYKSTIVIERLSFD